MIEPKIFRGMRDIDPEEMFLREKLLDRLKKIFHLYGFVPLETPAIEYVEILEGKYGGECDKLIYKLAYKDGNTLALRYDLTVPLARYVAMNKNKIQFPFKRYQIQPVWRAERAQLRQGRYREFYQCDVDIVGVDDIKADADIIALTYDCIKACGIADFVIRINDRNILFGLIESVSLPEEQAVEILRALDKLEKIGVDGVKEELLRLGCAEDKISILFELLALPIDEIKQDSCFARSEQLKKGIDNLIRLREILDALEIPKECYKFDLHLARGLDYYTGLIFETNLPSMPHIGSLSGGGRYDELMRMFSGENIPSVGTTIGLDRIMTVFVELDTIERIHSKIIVLFVNFGDETLTRMAFKLVRECRTDGIPAEIYYGAKKLRQQLEYANKMGIPFVAFLGENEISQNIVLVRDMKSGNEIHIPLSDFIPKFKRIFKKAEQ